MKLEAEKLWSTYVSVAKPLRIVRVATRFINVMPIPLPINDLSDILTAPPQVPPGLPQRVTAFVSRIISENPEIGAKALVSQAFEGHDNNRAPLTIEIDVFVEKEFGPDDIECWNYLDRLRVFKNKIFFESITERTAELFV